MSHPWFRVALVTLLALTDLIVYFYETGRLGSRLLLVFTLFLSFYTNPKSIMTWAKMLCFVLIGRNMPLESGKGISTLGIRKRKLARVVLI
jgi:hypothetical protein